MTMILLVKNNYLTPCPRHVLLSGVSALSGLSDLFSVVWVFWVVRVVWVVWIVWVWCICNVQWGVHCVVVCGQHYEIRGPAIIQSTSDKDLADQVLPGTNPAPPGLQPLKSRIQNMCLTVPLFWSRRLLYSKIPIRVSHVPPCHTVTLFGVMLVQAWHPQPPPHFRPCVCATHSANLSLHDLSLRIQHRWSQRNLKPQTFAHPCAGRNWTQTLVDDGDTAT